VVGSTEEGSAQEAALEGGSGGAEEPPLEVATECGICYGPLKETPEERVGLLDGCFHVFCLECIRSWRDKGMQLSDAQTVRLCPVCRVTAHLVIPSTRVPVSGADKDAITRAYKASLGAVPCRHFEYGKRECPFGSSCFYAHLLPDGTVAPYEPPRTRVAGDGVAQVVSGLSLMDFVQTKKRGRR